MGVQMVQFDSDYSGGGGASTLFLGELLEEYTWKYRKK